jgi:Cu/Ag efflux protein CusF
VRIALVVLLVNAALATGLLAGSLWSRQDVQRLTAEVERLRGSATPAGGGPLAWVVQGIVRGAVPDQQVLVLTHAEVPGLMGPMTMAFRVGDRGLLKGLEAGDRVEFTLVKDGDHYTVAGLTRHGSGAAGGLSDRGRR